MINQGSLRYDTQKYQKLIDDYLNLGSTELGKLVLTGEDLLDFAEAVGDIKDYYEEHKELKENYQELVNQLEYLFQGKEGTLVKRIINLVNDAKKVLE